MGGGIEGGEEEVPRGEKIWGPMAGVAKDYKSSGKAD